MRVNRAKNFLYGILALIFGVCLLGYGIYTLSNANTVTCGGQVMAAGDTCDHTTNGVSSGTYDYTQQQQNNQRDAWIELGVGALMLVGGFFMVRGGNRGGMRIPKATPGVYPQGSYPPVAPGAYPPPAAPGAYQQGTYPPQAYPPPAAPGAYSQGAYPPQAYPPPAQPVYPPQQYPPRQ